MKVKKILIVVLVVLTSLQVGAQALDKNGRILPAINTQTQSELNLKANLASPTFTGTPTASTAAVGTNTFQLATTAFVTEAFDTMISDGVAAQTLAIGDFVGGGVVFWVDPVDNSKGLVCSIEDQSNGIQWFNGSYLTTGATGTAVETGASNTDAIIAVQGSIETNYAAGVARAYNGGGFTDWYLPSKDELYQMSANRNTINGIATTNGGVNFGGGSSAYWSSTETGSSAWALFFGNNFQQPLKKNIIGMVRAVRAVGFPAISSLSTLTAEQTAQDALIDSKEDKINKSIDGTFSLNSDVLFPTEKATKTYVDASTNAKVSDAIVDAVTTVAPSQNAVFDAFALKADLASPSFTGTVAGIDKTMVGLANVDDTSDATKDAATATLTNKTLTSPVINTPTGIVKGDVGLGNVDNTTDLLKPISTATQTALNLKSNLASPAFTGVPLAPTAAAATDTEQIATTAFVTAAASSSNFVDLTTAQTIAGTKTFNSDIMISTLTVGRGSGGDYTSVAMGTDALDVNTTGTRNTAIGGYALLNTTGTNNTATGYYALQANTTGSNNTSIGSFSGPDVGHLVNSTAIGFEAKVTNSNTIQLGNTAVTEVRTSGFIRGNAFHASGPNYTSLPGGYLVWNLLQPASSTIRDGYTSFVNHKGTGAGGFRFYNVSASVDASTNPIVEINASGTLTANSLSTNSDISVNAVTLGLGGGNLNSNLAIGISALAANTTGTYNTAVGSAALGSNIAGAQNSAFGYQALKNNLTLNGSAFGFQALMNNTTGLGNTGVGYHSLKSNTTGFNNTAIGQESLLNNLDGKRNAALGKYALKDNIANDNTAVGYAALQSNTTGDFNVALGKSALLTNTTGNYNTAIGAAADVLSANLTNATAIGYGAIVSTSNTIQLGADGTNGATAISNVKTSGTLTSGAVTYPNTTGSNGQVLTTDGSGTLTWKTPTISGIEAAYPIGAIFISTISTNPATSLGFGTWVAFGAGRVLLGDGSGYAAGATGGSADAVVVSHDHMFTGDALPVHKHTGSLSDNGFSGGGADRPYVHPSSGNTAETTSSTGFGSTSAGTPSGTISTTGSSSVDANMQPYIVVYMWNRTN